MAADGIGPFEAWFGGAGAARRLADRGLPASVADTLALAAKGTEADPEIQEKAREFIDGLWTGIAVMIVNMCTVLNPRVVSLGGGYVRGDSGVLERIQELTERAAPIPPRIIRARFGADASLRGAVALALGIAQRPRQEHPRDPHGHRQHRDRSHICDRRAHVGAVHKVRQVFSHIGGKGVNVSRTLAALSAQTWVTGLIGEATLDQAAGSSRPPASISALPGRPRHPPDRDRHHEGRHRHRLRRGRPADHRQPSGPASSCTSPASARACRAWS